MIDWVNYIMQQGADGIFVDNLAWRTHCYASHSHICPDNPSDPDAAQNQAFALLLSQVRNVVKSHRSDGLVLGNSGDPLNRITGQSWPGFQQYLDSDTLEGYVCGGKTGSRLPDWHGLLSWSDLGQQLQPYLSQGKQILAISTMGSSGPQLREDAFLCYCAARVAGLTWYGYSNNVYASEIADLHRVRLGSALAPAVVDPARQLSYRVFERGVVAVNWSASAQSFPYKNPVSPVVATPPSPEFFYDLFAPSLTPIDLSATAGQLSVPAQSGRAFLFGSSTDYGLNRLSTSPAVQPPVHPLQPPLHGPINPPSGPPHTIS